MDESYVDYVEGNANAGIINNPDEFPVIDAALIESLNEEGGEENVSTGWHAIEFLLWGQDLNENGPGSRPVEDYTTAANADRRATYLAVTSDLLLVHLGSNGRRLGPRRFRQLPGAIHGNGLRRSLDQHHHGYRRVEPGANWPVSG